MGADDYVVKPFSPQELVSRVRAVLRRTQGAVAGALARVGDREDLSRALAAAEGIRDEWHRAHALAAVAGAMGRVTGEGDAQGAAWVSQAFRAARARGREEVWRHIQHFAPLLAALGRRVLTETWQRIQAAERPAGTGPTSGG